MSVALPPRPNKPGTEPVIEKIEEAPREALTENIRLEQQAGKEAVALSKTRIEEEMEAGRKMVELNEQRRNRKAV